MPAWGTRVAPRHLAPLRRSGGPAPAPRAGRLKTGCLRGLWPAPRKEGIWRSSGRPPLCASYGTTEAPWAVVFRDVSRRSGYPPPIVDDL
jgi:hypothetical protein